MDDGRGSLQNFNKTLVYTFNIQRPYLVATLAKKLLLVGYLLFMLYSLDLTLDKIKKPNRLYPPHTVFLRGSGQSYEFATALCSLLLGLSYDAYVVSGYAVRDITLKIMTRVNSPFPEEEPERGVVVEEEVDPKYVLKPPRDLRSKFLAYMEQREIDRAKDELQRQEEEKLKELQELEKPPFDDLHGLRVHAWVLIRAGKKDIGTSFFMEPNTGYAHPLDTTNYCGIESIWNHENYWVNLQDCSNGIANLNYDFTIITNWEHLLAGEPIQTREIKNATEMDDDELQLNMTYQEKHLDMPHPWSLPIDIPHHVIQKRFPNGLRQTWYRCALVEEYAPYIQPDGLITRICRYRDFDCSPDTLYVIEERYENRHDHMTKIVHRIEDGYITEYFTRGREDAVKEHSYYLDDNKVEAFRIIDFYHGSRFDCLSKLELTAELMREYYIGRSDFFNFREVTYAKRGHPPRGILEGPRRIVLVLVEKFDRNPEKRASDDIASRKFSVISKDIDLKFHYDTGKVTASTRHFEKPAMGEMGNRFTFNPDMTSGYQAEVGAKPPRQLNLFFLLERQIKEEEESLKQVREMDDMVAEFIRLRDLERAIPKLDVSIFHREQNLEYRQGMLEREQQQKEHREREVEEEMNFLNPYLTKLNYTFILTRAQAAKVREDCLNDFKQLLLKRANSIQNKFEELTLEIQKQYEWYTTVLETLTLAEEEQYFKQLNQNNFQLHIYEIRLARHRDLSGYRYKALEEYLDNHPALVALNTATE